MMRLFLGFNGYQWGKRRARPDYESEGLRFKS